MNATSKTPEAVATTIQHVGRYEVLGELASGGTGTVYLARLNGLGGFERLFAIKVLHKHLSTRPEIVEMLLKEAHLAGQIHHPHVVDMVEVSVTEDGRHYLVMGYIEGASLDDLFGHPKLDAIRRVRLGIAILLDAMSGLDAVHRATNASTGEPLGIVHRDISPANILIGMDGIGRIADFGIASARTHSTTSEPGIVRGTPRYMPPEQATGIGPIDARSDVFGLGAVLWEVITGEPLFDSHVSVEHILQQVVSATIPPPSDRNSRMPDAIDAVCLRALQRNPDERYRSVGEFRDALAQIAQESGLIATPRELVDELSTFFADRVEQRRALSAQAARRRSGTQLRAVSLSHPEASMDDDKPAPPKSFAPKALSHTQLGVQPLRDAAADALARESLTRSHIISTRIGIDPTPPTRAVDIRATLDDLLGHDEEDDEKLSLAVAPARSATAKRSALWALLGVALVCTAAWLGYRALAHRPPPAPIATLVVRPPSPVPVVAPAPVAVVAPAPVAVVVPAPVAVAAPAPVSVVAPLPRKLPLKRAAVLRPRPTATVARAAAPAAPVQPEPVTELPAALPLETNPYRLRQ